MRQASIASMECRNSPHPVGGARRTKGVVRIGFVHVVTTTWLLVSFIAILPRSPAQGIGQGLRVVQGRVINAQDSPQPNAVVYLQNQKSLEVKTYIATADGSYRFGQLSGDVDYQLWAKYQNSKSKVRSISSFDSKKQFNFDLKLEPSK
jgi:hypothetical protein